MSDEEEFDDDDIYIRTVPCRPLTFWSIITFVLNLIMGMARAVLVATDQLNDDVIGAQGFSVTKKEFADGMRQELEALPTTEE